MHDNIWNVQKYIKGNCKFLDSTIPLRFQVISPWNALEYLEIIYIAKN